MSSSSFFIRDVQECITAAFVALLDAVTERASARFNIFLRRSHFFRVLNSNSSIALIPRGFRPSDGGATRSQAGVCLIRLARDARL